MKLYIVSALLLVSISLFSQDEAIIIENEANLVFSGDVKLVLDDISLTNEGTLDQGSGELVVASTSIPRSISTNQYLTLNAFATDDNAIDINAEGAFEISDFVIGSTDNIVFSDTSSLTLTGLVNAVGELTMESGAALWVKGTITEAALDNVTIERIGPHNNATGKYSVYGSPVNATPFSILGTSAQSWIYEYNENTKDFTDPSEMTMTAGKGYFVAFPGDGEGKISFNGSLNYTNFDYSVNRTNSGPSADRGFNLIANPFSCPVDFEDFISDSGNESVLEESTIWIWDDFSSDAGGGTSDDYLAINYLGPSSFDITDSRNGGLANWDGTINVAQGFFVKAGSSGSVSFKQSMKTLNGNDDASFFRVASSPKYWLKIEDKVTTTEGANTLLGFTADATYGKDYLYDASRFGSGFAIYSLIDDQKLAIQGLPLAWLSDYLSEYAIPIGYNVEEAGNYSISLASSQNDELDALYLNDHVNLKSIDILSEHYDFSTQAGSINDRFSISLEPLSMEKVLSSKKESVNVLLYSRSNEMILEADFEGRYKILTLSGKLSTESSFEPGETIIPLVSQVYIVLIESREGVSSYKVKVSD